MNRREAVAVLVLIAVAVAAGLIDRDTSHAATPTPATTTATAAATTDFWQQQYADAEVEFEANLIALGAQPKTGQPLERLHNQWCTAVQNRNRADAHLGGTRQIHTKDCK